MVLIKMMILIYLAISNVFYPRPLLPPPLEAPPEERLAPLEDGLE